MPEEIFFSFIYAGRFNFFLIFAGAIKNKIIKSKINHYGKRKQK